MGIVISVIVAYPATETLEDVLSRFETLDGFTSPTTAYALTVTSTPLLPGTDQYIPAILSGTTILHGQLEGRRKYNVTAAMSLNVSPGMVILNRLLPIPFSVSATAKTTGMGTGTGTGTCRSGGGGGTRPCIPLVFRESPVSCVFASVEDLWLTQTSRARVPRSVTTPTPPVSPALTPRDVMVMLKQAVRDAKTPSEDGGVGTKSPGTQFTMMATVTLDLKGHSSWVVNGTVPFSFPCLYQTL